jgi:hypothetical protein
MYNIGKCPILLDDNFFCTNFMIHTDTNLLSELEQIFSTLPGDRSLRFQPGPLRDKAQKPFSGNVEVSRGGQTLRFPYLIKHSLNPVAILQLASLRKNMNKPFLVATRHATRHQADALREAGIYYADIAGNAFLDAPGLLLWISGRRPAKPHVIMNERRTLHTSSLRLLYALLVDTGMKKPEIDIPLVSLPVREIATRIDMSSSTVGWCMTELIRQGLIVNEARGLRHLVNRPEALERWMQGYIERLKPKLRIARYRPENPQWWQGAVLEPGQFWSGEVAAKKMTGDIKPGTATIVGTSLPHSFVLRHGLQLDPEGSVELIRPISACAWSTHDHPDCAHPLLVYADLLAIEDNRTHEVARTIYDRYLRSIIEAD